MKLTITLYIGYIGGATLIGYNTEDPSVNHWNGIAPAHYDGNDSSTPENMSLSWVDTPNTTDPIIYKVYLHSSIGGSTTLFLNRTFDVFETH